MWLLDLFFWWKRKKQKGYFFIPEEPNEEECAAMQRVWNKIKDANLTFEIVSATQLARVLVHYKVEGFADKKVTPVD